MASDGDAGDSWAQKGGSLVFSVLTLVSLWRTSAGRRQPTELFQLYHMRMSALEAKENSQHKVHLGFQGRLSPHWHLGLVCGNLHNSYTISSDFASLCFIDLCIISQAVSFFSDLALWPTFLYYDIINSYSSKSPIACKSSWWKLPIVRYYFIYIYMHITDYIAPHRNKFICIDSWTARTWELFLLWVKQFVLKRQTSYIIMYFLLLALDDDEVILTLLDDTKTGNGKSHP